MPVLEGKRMTIFLSPKKKEGQKKVVSTASTTPPTKLTVVKADKMVKVENSSEEEDKEMRNAQV